MMTLERRRDLITVLEPYFLPKGLHSTRSYFIKAIDHTFYGFTGMITHLGCWENTRKACKSRAEAEWFTSFSRVLRKSRVAYHAGKPIESVVYCLNFYPLKIFHLFRFPSWKSNDPKIIGIKTYLFENFSQKKRIPQILGGLSRVKIG